MPRVDVDPAAARILGSAVVNPTILSRLYFPASDESARLGWLTRLSEVSPDSLVSAAVASEAAVERNAEEDTSLVAGLKSLSLPVLVMTGNSDAVSDPATARDVANVIPHATYLLVDGGGYAVFSTDPTEVQQAVSSFVSAAKTLTPSIT